MKRILLEAFFERLLQAHQYEDYGPNGLQIEGKDELQRIVFALSATRESVEYAVSVKACALVVHHGLFWKFHGPKTITGSFYHRVAPLIKNDINLFAFHLPLDAQIEMGNAKTIADLLQLHNIRPFGENKKTYLGVSGTLPAELSGLELKNLLEKKLSHPALHASPYDHPQKKIKSIGIITGGANSKWTEAAKENLDAYITGEMSEHDWHDAREANIHMYALGHDATETPGLQSLEKRVREAFPLLETHFFASHNPA